MKGRKRGSNYTPCIEDKEGNIIMEKEKIQSAERTESRKSRETTRIDELNIEWSRYPEIVERQSLGLNYCTMVEEGMN